MMHNIIVPNLKENFSQTNLNNKKGEGWGGGRREASQNKPLVLSALAIGMAEQYSSSLPLTTWGAGMVPTPVRKNTENSNSHSRLFVTNGSSYGRVLVMTLTN